MNNFGVTLNVLVFASVPELLTMERYQLQFPKYHEWPMAQTTVMFIHGLVTM